LAEIEVKNKVVYATNTKISIEKRLSKQNQKNYY